MRVKFSQKGNILKKVPKRQIIVVLGNVQFATVLFGLELMFILKMTS